MSGNARASARHLAETQAKAKTLLEALPYIEEFAGTRVVVKVGGEITEATASAAAFTRDLLLLKHVGVDVVLCHGGGPQISRLMETVGTSPEFVGGLRVTDAETMRLTAMVLLGDVNRTLVGHLNAHGSHAVGLSGVDGRLFLCEPKDPALGFVGEIVSVDPRPVVRLLEDGYMPVVASVGMDEDGNAFNINADTAAGALAGALEAEKLIVLTNVEGLYEDFGDADSLVSEIDTAGLRRMYDAGGLHTGMLPKVAAVLHALDAGVAAAHILDGRIEHSVLLEIFTPEGIGTKVTGEAAT
ncbi:MAG: acetylglutamate kinase [Acidimicrobiia bacterium]|nr:acetylglutamate kinase [Acidimicrobiia bacterium]